MSAQHLLGSAEFYQSYDTIAADLNLIELSQSSEVTTAGWQAGRPCMAIYVGGVGDLVLEMPMTASPAANVKLLHVSGWLWVRASKIIASGTTATNVSVLWN